MGIGYSSGTWAVTGMWLRGQQPGKVAGFVGVTTLSAVNWIIGARRGDWRAIEVKDILSLYAPACFPNEVLTQVL
jgi:hypothetical protein